MFLGVWKTNSFIMKILDCTLRDGGYYTNWDFNSKIVDAYILAMNELPIDYLLIVLLIYHHENSVHFCYIEYLKNSIWAKGVVL